MGDFEAKAREIFNRYDTNNNGSIEKKEFIPYFREVLQSLGAEMPESEIEKIALEGISEYDLNGDGSLQFEEFVGMLRFLVEEKGLKL